MSKGRGIVHLIIHMSHLTPVGWGFLGLSILCSAMVWQSSKKVIPFWIRKQAIHSYPTFEWIVVPRYGQSVSIALFLITLFFLGYFCDSSDKEGDIIFFKVIAVVWLLFWVILVFRSLLKAKCFMRNNGAIFISRFAPLGLYKRISIDKESIVENVEGKNNEQPVITFRYNGCKICKLYLIQYSDKGVKILRDMLEIKS